MRHWTWDGCNWVEGGRPGCPPPCPPTPDFGTLYARIAALESQVWRLSRGVTDGTRAQPGQPGEFLEINTGGTFPAGFHTQSATCGVIPAGDWDIQSGLWLYDPSGSATENITGGGFALVPLPPGASGTQWSLAVPSQNSAEAVPEGFNGISINSPRIQGLFAVPTPLVYNIVTNQMGGGTAGRWSVWVGARRMR